MDNNYETEIGYEAAEKISDYIFLDSKRYDSQMKGE